MDQPDNEDDGTPHGFLAFVLAVARDFGIADIMPELAPRIDFGFAFSFGTLHLATR